MAAVLAAGEGALASHRSAGVTDQRNFGWGGYWGTISRREPDWARR
jgi:hypothetical protein